MGGWQELNRINREEEKGIPGVGKRVIKMPLKEFVKLILL